MENHLEKQITFDDDLLDRKELSQKIERYLAVEEMFVDGSLVVSLNAPFGSGKTTFLKMWEHDLNSRGGDGDETFLPIFLNAWESDFCADPLASLLYSLIEAIQEHLEASKKDELINAARELTWLGVSIGNGLLAKVTGVNLLRADKFSKEKTADDSLDFLDIHKKKTEALKNLKLAIQAVVNDKGMPPILFFVDELDRCKPDFAIHFLETIKHVFDIDKLTFLLAVDLDQLENSAKALFGANLNFPEYHRKFSHRTIELPKPKSDQLTIFAHQFAKKYLYVSEIRNTGLNYDSNKEEQIVELLNAFNIKARQAEAIFRSIGYALASKDLKKHHSTDRMWEYKMLLILLCVIKEADPPTYTAIRGKPKDLDTHSNYLLSKLNQDEAKWWFFILFNCCKMNYEYKKDPELQRIAREHYSYEDPQDFIVEIERMSSSWSLSHYNIHNVFEHIETLTTEMF